MQVLHRPGHSPSDTLFHDRESGEVIGGDHLIGHISSNPLISRPLGGKSGEPGGGRPRALITYMRSMRETREMEGVSVILPGHGEPVTDHVKLIDERFALHERRARKIGGLIEERPRSAYEIAQSLWGNVAVTQAYLTLCEVLGHVDLLLEEGSWSSRRGRDRALPPADGRRRPGLRAGRRPTRRDAAHCDCCCRDRHHRPDHPADLGTASGCRRRPARSFAPTAGIVSRVVEESALEQELFAVGEKLAAALPRTSRNPLKAADEKAMELASKDAELKAALFRFVDVVPACRNLDDLARHLTGFLGEVGEPPPPISAAMKMGSSRAGRTALGAAAARGVKHMAHRFIVGESPKEALGVFRDLWKDGVASSVDLLGEATVTQGEAQRYAERCDEALATLVESMRGWPARPHLETDSLRLASAREPEREGLGAHAADEARRPAARPARRGPAAARPAARAPTSSARTCTSTWSRWTRATRCSS